MRFADQQVLAYLSRTSGETVSTAETIAEGVRMPLATVEESLKRLAGEGLVSSHGHDTILWMSRQQSG